MYAGGHLQTVKSSNASMKWDDSIYFDFTRRALARAARMQIDKIRHFVLRGALCCMALRATWRFVPRGTSRPPYVALSDRGAAGQTPQITRSWIDPQISGLDQRPHHDVLYSCCSYVQLKAQPSPSPVQSVGLPSQPSQRDQPDLGGHHNHRQLDPSGRDMWHCRRLR